MCADVHGTCCPSTHLNVVTDSRTLVMQSRHWYMILMRQHLHSLNVCAAAATGLVLCNMASALHAQSPPLLVLTMLLVSAPGWKVWNWVMADKLLGSRTPVNLRALHEESKLSSSR